VLYPPTEGDDSVLVEFGGNIQKVRRDSLRWLLCLTKLARVVQQTGRVKAWTVRKAHEQGTIRADAIGQFAGHKVHYYDVARLSAVIEQLSARDIWTVGTLVIHGRFGPGKIVAPMQPANQSGQAEPTRLVQFLNSSSPVSASVQVLRRLLASHLIARSLQLNRRTFARQAAHRGVYPDYVASYGHVREFYDESRIEEIRTQWFNPTRSNPIKSPGFILDAEGDIATVDCRDARGGVHFRYVKFPTVAHTTDVTALRELVSLRQLARNEQMSRYKLSRLLTAVGIQPVHQHGRTLYFDQRRAHEALQARIERERSAVTLAALSRRTRVSEAVLARKVHRGCIHALDHHATHCVDGKEAARIEQVVRSLRSRSKSPEALSICRLHARGRAGSEVACWDIARLLEVGRTLQSPQRRLLFDQVGWMCDGVGQRLFGQALESYLPFFHSVTASPEARLCARLLLELIDHLPAEFSRYRIGLVLVESGRMNLYRLLNERVRRFAAEAGCDDKPEWYRFRVRIDQSLTELLDAEDGEHRTSELTDRSLVSSASVHREDDCTPGAIIVSLADHKPTVGIILRVEHRSWNTLSRRWEKTTLVRFAHGEQRINPYTLTLNPQRGESRQCLPLLLRSSEVIELVRLKRKTELCQPAERYIVKRAS
jgi:hypothetical protein